MIVHNYSDDFNTSYVHVVIVGVREKVDRAFIEVYGGNTKWLYGS